MKFCADHFLPDPTFLPFLQFRQFIEKRKKILGDELRVFMQ